MRWKKMPAWVKGGWIGCGVGSAMWILFWIIAEFTSNALLGSRIFDFIISPVCAWPYFTSGIVSDEVGICIVILGLPLNFIVYGGIGALIGAVVGMAKSNKKGKNKR